MAKLDSTLLFRMAVDVKFYEATARRVGNVSRLLPTSYNQFCWRAHPLVDHLV